MLILDAICEGEEHTSFDEIFERVQAKAPGINQATLYRTLDFLCELGLVVSAEIDGRTVFEIAGDTPHHHLVCRRCGAAQELADYHFHQLRTHLLREHGFKADISHLAVTGLCSQCTQSEI
jgi:Fur family ferric uptake transcriptional regulator